jgi:hypothetical protein
VGFLREAFQSEDGRCKMEDVFSQTSSSNRGKKSRISKIFPDCRTKTDNALPEFSNFVLVKASEPKYGTFDPC